MRYRNTQKKHESVCRMIDYALTHCDDAEAWDGVSLVLRHRLSGYERACLLIAASRALPSDDVVHVLSAVEKQECIGMPMPPFLDHMQDATWWADHASVPERKAVLVAAFASLSPGDQHAFLAYVDRRAAA
ncbi:MAG: hypothetical protein HKO04_14305 [Silicimonas sp.]|nr:hypothetical protein [Silicimonas sp.]